MSDSTLMAMAERFLSALKHCQLLQMRVAQADETGMTLVLPWSPAIVGNPQTGARVEFDKADRAEIGAVTQQQPAVGVDRRHHHVHEG